MSSEEVPRATALRRLVNLLIDLARLDLRRQGGKRTPEALSTISQIREQLDRQVRVAVVRMDGLGDWVMTLPLVNALVSSPDLASVTIVAPRRHSGLLGNNSSVEFLGSTDHTILNPSPRGLVGKVLAVSRRGQRQSIASGARESGAFDLVILPRWDSDLGLNARAWAVGARSARVGHDPAFIPFVTGRERSEREILDGASSDPIATNHEIEHLRVLMNDLGLGVAITAGYGRAFFQVERAAPQENEDPVVVVHAAAQERKREWPADRWSALIARILEHGAARVVLVGGPSDHELNETIARDLGPRVSNVARTLTLAELPSLLADATMFIGNDSGPMHIASSLQVPVVVVSCHPANGDPAHRNSPSRFGPWGTLNEVLRPPKAIAPCTDSCSQAYPHCICEIGVDEVFDAYRSISAEARTP